MRVVPCSYVSFCTLILSGNVLFYKNKADSGAALYLTGSLIQWTNGKISFIDNFARLCGGAIYIADKCNQINGIIFSSVFNTTANFSGNTAQLSGESMYFSLQFSCEYIITNISNHHSLLHYPSLFNYTEPFSKEITSTPFRLNLSMPAKCQYKDTHDTCSVNDIMLGEEIVISAQVLDYFGSVTESVQFLVACHQNCVNYNNEGSNPVLAHNDTFRGVKITGI